MKTERLYQKNVYLKNWESVITSVSRTDDGAFIELARTAFFPTGGGQSCDTGLMGTFPVVDVREVNPGETSLTDPDEVSPSPAGSQDEKHQSQVGPDDEKHQSQAGPDDEKHQSQAGSHDEGEKIIIHRIICEASEIPSPGDKVSCSIDWERRFDNMQRHCGEHILSGIFYSLCGGVNRGFHMGDDYMTIDIRLEENPEFTEITHELAEKAELAANQVIWSDAPVTVMHFESREEAEKMPLRKALAFDEDISIVSVGSVENAADCVACCGTHPSSAGQVGLIKIFKVEKYKDMFRIYFEAGKRALLDYELKHNMLTTLSGRYSSSIEDFPAKIKSQEDKLKAVKDELYHIKKALIDAECEKLDKISDSSSSSVIVYKLLQLSMDDAFDMAKRYMGKCSIPLMLYSQKDTSYILVSDGSVDCGSLVKEYAGFYKGKGGGNKVSARAIFSSDEDAALFADLIEKHLK